MNFFDYDLTRQATATPPATAGEDSNATAQPSLNDEVNEVVGQLGRLWGGFRKQVRAVEPPVVVPCIQLKRACTESNSL